MPKGKNHKPEQIVAILHRLESGETGPLVTRHRTLTWLRPPEMDRRPRARPLRAVGTRHPPATGEPPGQPYDLEAVPRETANLAAAHPEVVARPRAELARIQQSSAPGHEQPASILSSVAALIAAPGSRRTFGNSVSPPP